MAKILLVEDDPSLGSMLKTSLEFDSYSVEWAQNIGDGKVLLAKQMFDLLILDLNLPDGSGIDLAKALQKAKSELPIIILTAMGDEETIITAFNAGVLDFMEKPFSNRELKARIKVVLREKAKAPSNFLKFAEIILFPDKREVIINDKVVDLNRREFDILHCLLLQSEGVVTRTTLMDRIDRDGEINDRTMDSHISRIRSKIRQNQSKVQITSIYGVGYRLEKN